MAVIQFKAKPVSRIAAAARERACRGGTTGNTVTAEDFARREELEQVIAYSTPITKGEVWEQWKLFAELADHINDGTATSEQFRMATSIFKTASAFRSA